MTPADLRGAIPWHACAVRAKGWLPVTAMIAGWGTVWGCSIPDTSQRGFGSKQVLKIREDGLGLRSFSYDLSAIYVAHAISGVTASNGVSAPYDRTLLDLTTGAERPISPGVLEADLLPTVTGTGRSLVLQHFASDAIIPPTLTSSALPFVTLTFLDEVAGTTVDVANVHALGVSLGSTRSDAILVGRPAEDGSMDVHPWYGPPEALVRMPDTVNFVAGRDHQGFLALTANPGDANQAVTRFPFDTSSAQGVPVSPGSLDTWTTVLGDADASASTPPATLPLNDVTPAIYCPPASAAPPVQGCLLFYDRNFSDGTSSGFVRFLDGTTEMRLKGQSTSHLADTMSLSPTGQDMYWLQSEGAGAQTRIYGWHIGDGTAASCVIPHTADRRNLAQSAWQPGAGRFAVVAQSNSQSSTMPAAWALVEGTAGGGCQMVMTGNNLISQLQFSPSGRQLALLESDPAGNSTVYLGAPDGTPPVAASTGSYYFNIGYLDERHLLLWHSNTDGYSVSWLDASSVPAMEHAIADRVRWDARGSWVWLSSKWVLLADADLQQDGSYSLDVVNIETGEERLVSRGVVDFRVPWNTPPAGATELVVAYTVRSRAESTQDGIWVAHLPLSDFADKGSTAGQ